MKKKTTYDKKDSPISYVIPIAIKLGIIWMILNTF